MGFFSYRFSHRFLKAMAANIDPIGTAQDNVEVSYEPKREMSTFDLDEDEAIRKVEAATTVDPNAQQGVKNVEAVTLTWTKTSLACAFAWSVLPIIRQSTSLTA